MITTVTVLESNKIPLRTKSGIYLIYYELILQQEFADSAKASMDNREADRKLLETICKNFLKGRLPTN